MSGRGSYVPAGRMLLAVAIVLASSLALYIVGGVLLSRQAVPLETANYPYRANTSGGVAIRMGPGSYTVTLRLDDGVTGAGKACCAPAAPGGPDTGVACERLSPGVPVSLSCDGPGIIVCYNASVPPMHPRVGVVEVVKAWP